MAVKLQDLLLALEFVSSAPPSQNAAYVDRMTGNIHWAAEGIDEELPEDVEDGERYVAVPHKVELDLGSRLALEFAAQVLPNDYDRIRGFFQQRGGYGRLKDFLQAKGRLDEWHAFEDRATEEALREWCADNGIAVSDENAPHGTARSQPR